jgi:hypothetical protein
MVTNVPLFSVLDMFHCPTVKNMTFARVVTKAPMPELWQMGIHALPEKCGIAELWQMFC